MAFWSRDKPSIALASRWYDLATGAQTAGGAKTMVGFIPRMSAKRRSDAVEKPIFPPLKKQRQMVHWDINQAGWVNAQTSTGTLRGPGMKVSVSHLSALMYTPFGMPVLPDVKMRPNNDSPVFGIGHAAKSSVEYFPSTRSCSGILLQEVRTSGQPSCLPRAPCDNCICVTVLGSRNRRFGQSGHSCSKRERRAGWQIIAAALLFWRMWIISGSPMVGDTLTQTIPALTADMAQR
mmetsp:Transcript_29751/g.63192  ORF Transcript_29751/g.63192 Transcript_29751/m.63192 type:complete len:235 (+) Transcript_29751:3199-3903(+)